MILHWTEKFLKTSLPILISSLSQKYFWSTFVIKLCLIWFLFIHKKLFDFEPHQAGLRKAVPQYWVLKPGLHHIFSSALWASSDPEVLGWEVDNVGPTRVLREPCSAGIKPGLPPQQSIRPSSPLSILGSHFNGPQRLKMLLLTAIVSKIQISHTFLNCFLINS